MVKSKIQSFSTAEIARYCRQRMPDLVQRGSEWRGPCPIHQGTGDSFTVNPESGRWFCHSQCQEGGDLFCLEMKLSNRRFPEAKEKVERIVGRSIVSKPAHSTSRRQIVATYDYTNEAGDLLYQRLRFEPKEFRYRRPDGRAGWEWNLRGVRRVPYRLPEILNRPVVYTTEGEKDADTLWRLGIAATTAGAAGKWDAAHAKHLEGKQVVILFDNDCSGRKDALDKARSLLGIAETIKVVELPDIAPKGDVTDWIEAGHSRDELGELVEAASVLDEDGLVDLEKRWFPVSAEPLGTRRVITDLSQLPSVWKLDSRLEWAVDRLIPRGSVTLISAESGTGKSWLAYALAGSIARGHEFLGRGVKQMSALCLDGENPLYVVKDKLENLGLPETPSLQIWGGWVDPTAPGPGSPIIQKFAREEKGLIIYDSLIVFHEGSEQSSTETRAFMDQFRLLANLGATVIVIHHTGKAETAKKYRGSSDIKASVDTAYHLQDLSPDVPELDRLRLQCFKGRSAPGQDLAMQFRAGEGFVATDMPDRVATTSDSINQLLGNGTAANQKEIIEALRADGFSAAQIRSALKTGVDSGHLKRSKGTKNEHLYELVGEIEEVLI